MNTNESIVLHVIAGSSPQLSRVFTAGVPVPPFSVGSCGEWKISAPDVDGAHFYLAFDGQRLHVAAVSPGSNLFVLGVGVGTAFVPLAAPCNLFFGGACIAVSASAQPSRTVPLSRRSRNLPDLSRAAQARTHVFDVSQVMQMRTQRIEISASMLASLREAPSAARTTVEKTGSHEVLPARVSTLSGKLDLGSTMYDGGALRERAAQMASSSLAPTAQPLDALAGAEPAADARRGLFQKPLLALRRASRARQLALLLAPLAAAIWGVQGAGSLAAASGAAAPPAVAHVAPAKPKSSAAPPVLARVSSSPTSVVQLAAAPVPSDGLERAALAAAFSGNKLEAAALYDRLAASHNARVFALAAQLARADRVRKP